MPRPKKPAGEKAPTSGSAYLRRHNLRYLSVPLSPEARSLLEEAMRAQGERFLGPWAARVLEEGARAALARKSGDSEKDH